MSDRNETEDMTAATCSKPSSNPAAGRECMDSSATVDEVIDTDDQPYRRCTQVQAQGYGPLLISWGDGWSSRP